MNIKDYRERAERVDKLKEAMDMARRQIIKGNDYDEEYILYCGLMNDMWMDANGLIQNHIIAILQDQHAKIVKESFSYARIGSLITSLSDLKGGKNESKK